MRSASASRSRSPPSTARGLSDLYDALRAALPDETEHPAEPRAPKTRRRAGARPEAPTPIRVARGRAAERRQVDADQPAARRGAPAHRTGSRHHPRRHRGRRRMARPHVPRPRHRRHAAALADRGEAREALGRRRAQRHPLRRGGGPADGCRAAVRGAGPAHRRPGRARGPRARDRHEQVGPGRRQRRRDEASCARRPITGCRRSRACRWSRCRG